MKHNAFTYGELFSFGWEKTKSHGWFLFCVGLLYVVITGAATPIPVANAIVSLFLMIAVVSMTLRIADGHVPSFGDLLKPFKTYKVAWHAFLATLLVMLAVIGGLVLLILPGIYLATRLKFYIYSIVEDENLTATGSLKRSMEMTKGIFWKLFGLNILLALFNLGGALLLGVGLLVTIPISAIAYAHLYRKISSHRETSEPRENHEGAHIA